MSDNSKQVLNGTYNLFGGEGLDLFVFENAGNASESVDCIELPNIVVLHNIVSHRRLKIAGQMALVSKPRILYISRVV